MASMYNREGYFSPTEFEAMTRIEKAEKKARKLANVIKLRKNKIVTGIN